MTTSRRDFLRNVALAGGWLAYRGLVPSKAMAAGKAFPAGEWRGNYPSSCHDVVRDGSPAAIPNVAPSRRADIVVVGGGLAGLCAAYKLRDANVLLLEHLDRLGGHAVRDRWESIWYSGASAYFVAPEPPLDALYEELKLPLKKIHEPSDSAILSWNAITDTWGAGMAKLPYPQRVKDSFARAKKEMVALAGGDDYPTMPIGETSEASRAFDRVTFADWLTKEKGYHPAVKAYIDLYCRSAFGARSSASLSAFAGLNFYLSEFTDRYTFAGGNAEAAEIMRDRIDEAGASRIVSSASVVRVEQQGATVKVTYMDRAGRAVAVEAKSVIMASPKYVTKHVVAGLPEDQVAAMSELKYGSYLVANVLCSSAITQGSYDTWVDTAPFTDAIVADWVTRAPGEKRTGKQVLTIYWPVGQAHESLLEDGAYDALRASAVEYLELLWPGAEAKVEDVRLYRWGHALCHAAPGWYVNKAHVASRPFGRILFGHSDNQGLPAFESALIEGMVAAEKARELAAG